MISMLFLLVGCTPEKLSEDQKKVPEEAKFLTENQWAYYDANTGETEKLTFGKDFTFFYNCECGEPIGDSDIYDMWRYDAENETIYMTISYEDEEIEEEPIRIIKNNGYRLVLEINGEIKAFEACNDWYYAPEVNYEYAEYFKGYNARTAMTSLEGDVLTVAPYYYDGDIKEHRDLQNDEKLAENAVFFELSIHSVMKDEEIASDFNFTELTKEDVALLIDGGGGNGFVWYNENLEIEKILFYGEIIIQE